MHRITCKENIYVIEITGAATADDVIHALRDAFDRPDYFDRNDIVIFSKEFFKVQVNQLELITQFILLNFPDKSSSRRSAVVVPHGFNKSIVEVWASTAEQLPYELRIFSDLKAAEKWTADSQD